MTASKSPRVARKPRKPRSLIGTLIGRRTVTGITKSSSDVPIYRVKCVCGAKHRGTREHLEEFTMCGKCLKASGHQNKAAELVKKQNELRGQYDAELMKRLERR